MSSLSALDQAIRIHDGVAKLAAAIGVSQSAISNWRSRGTSIDALHCAEIEAICKKAVRRWDLRPDDWHRIWPELIGTEGAPPVPVSDAREVA